MISPSPIAATIAAYCSDRGELLALLERIEPEVGAVFVIDNGIAPALRKEVVERTWACPVTLLGDGSNLGVGAAQNFGAKAARHAGAEFILLLDDDSLPAPGMATELLLAYRRLTAGGLAVAGVGPRYVDQRSGRANAFVKQWGCIRRRPRCRPGIRQVETDFLIASGTLVPVAVLDRIGGHDEELFLDHVDTDWCLRARAAGFRLFGVCSAVMEHALGDRSVRVPCVPRPIPLYAPDRLRLIVRNSILLWRRPYVPWCWALNDFSRLLGLIALHLVATRPAANIGRAVASGLKQALQLLRKSGCRPPPSA